MHKALETTPESFAPSSPCGSGALQLYRWQEAELKKILSMILLIVMAGCGVPDESYCVDDVTKPRAIAINKDPSQGNIHSISVIAKGHLDGSAEIILILNGKPYKTEHLSGDVDFQWGGDWYSDAAQIEYKPLSVKNGYLSLHYRFEDI